MASTDNRTPGPAYVGGEMSIRRSSEKGHHVVESLDSIQMHIEDYAVHEQAEMQAWLISSQDSGNGLLSATIDAVRRQSYTKVSSATHPSQHGHSYPTPAKTIGIPSLSTHLESPDKVPDSSRLEVKPSAIPLPKSYYTSPLATPRGAKSPRSPRTGIPSSCLPVSPTTPCAFPATPKKGASPSASPATPKKGTSPCVFPPTPKKGATLPEDEEDSQEKEPPEQIFSFSAPLQKHPGMGYTQRSTKTSQKPEHVTPPAPRFSADHEVPIFATDQAEDQTEDLSENMGQSPKFQHNNNNMASWTSGIVAGAAAVQNSCFSGDKASLSGSGQEEDAVDLSVLVQASGDSFLKGLQDSGLLPTSMTGSQRDGDHSRQGSWPKLGFVDNNEQMDVEMLSGTLKLPSNEKSSTYFQNNTLYGASPPLSPRPDEEIGRSVYLPPSQYACAYGSGSGSTLPADTGVHKGFFEGLFSMFGTGGNHKGNGGSRENHQIQEPRSIVEFTDAQQAPCLDPAEIARDLPTAALPQEPSASPPPSITPSSMADPSSPCRTLTEYSTDLKAEGAKDDTMTSLSPGRFVTYGTGGYADSPRDCSVSNIYPPNSARSEYYAYRRGGWVQGNDTMAIDGDDIDVDGEQLSAQLQKLLSSSVIMNKESAAEEQQAAGWQADLEAEANASNDAPRLAPRTGFAPMTSGAYSMESPRVRLGHVALTKLALEEASSAGVPAARPEIPGQHVWQQQQQQHHPHHRPPISHLPCVRPGSRRDTGSTECDDGRSENTESTVVVTDTGINSAEELCRAVMVGTHRSTWSSVSTRHNVGNNDSNSGRTMSLVDMVEVQSQKAGAGSNRAAEIRPMGGRPTAAAAAASVTGESENSEAERLEVLKEELGRVLKLLTSRPPEEQDKDKIRKLLDLQVTIDGVQSGMQAPSRAGQNPVQETKPAQQAGGGSPRAVEVSVDFTHEGPVLCVVQDGSAGKGPLAAPEILPAPDSACPKPRAEPAPSKRMIRSLLRRQRGQPGCFSRLFHCGCYPAADKRPRSNYPAIDQPANNPASTLQF